VPDDLVNVRYMVDDVDAAIAFYTTHLGFTLRSSAALLSPTSSGATCGCSSAAHELGWPSYARRAHPAAGRAGIEFISLVEDIAAEVERLRRRLTFRNDIVSGPGGRQILLEDPAGNPIELFQPAGA
jgi:catechol 2,3-dioxygenase-like lactoylglutathione lyase family enzyme